MPVWERLRKVTELREFMIFIIVIAGSIAMAIASPYFLTSGNLLAVLLGVSVDAIVAVGMTVLLVSGGFDLSVGSVLAFAGAATALLLKSGVPAVMAIVVGLASGAALGFVNGLIVARLRINPFITTLGMMGVVRGLVLVMTGGYGISGLPSSFTILGQGKLLGVQSLVWVMAVVVIVGDILLRNSRFFRQNYYLGGNERSAILSGISVDRLKLFNYTLSGLLAAVAGVLLTARLGTASVTAGQGLELRVIAAVIIGGASLSGGEGTVLGAFLGALLMGLITNALNLLGVDVYWQSLVVGATLLVAVVIDQYGKLRVQRRDVTVQQAGERQKEKEKARAAEV